MNVLLIYAHPDRNSFNGVMRDTAVSYLTQAGHQVRQSELASAAPVPFPKLAAYRTKPTASDQAIHETTSQRE